MLCGRPLSYTVHGATVTVTLTFGLFIAHVSVTPALENVHNNFG